MNPLDDLQGLDPGKVLALVKAFPNGREGVDAVLRGKMRITLEEVERCLFDKNGRCIPKFDRTVVFAPVRDPNPNSYLHRLAVDFDTTEMLNAWSTVFRQPIRITEADYRARIFALVEQIKSDPRIANLLNGAWYPILLPKIAKGDYGNILECQFLPAVKLGYERAFTNRKFVNHLRSEPSEQVTIVDERHRQVIADMEHEQIVGIVCYPLQGFSVHAQRQMATLMPENFSLLGAMDAAASIALYPLQLSQDSNTPVRVCSAVQWQKPDSSLCFRAPDGQLGFHSRCRLGVAYDNYGGGFLLRG